MRLTENKNVKEMSMVELAHNCCYAENGKARYREYDMDMDARDFARNLMSTLTKEELPLDDASFDEEILENLQYDCFSDIRGLIALFYRNLWAMADLREKLKVYEDAEEQGLLEIIECHSKTDEGILTIVECHCEDCTCAVHVEGHDQTMYCERYRCHVQRKGFCNHACKRVPAAEEPEKTAPENAETRINTKCETDFHENETVTEENETEIVEIDTENVVEAAEILNAESYRGMLTECDNLGNWGVKGLPWKELYVGQTITREIHDKLYGCLFKLMEYEATGLSPEEVERLQEDR